MPRQRPDSRPRTSPAAAPEPAAPGGVDWLLACALAILVLVLVQSLLPVVTVASWDVEPWSELGSAPSTSLNPTATAWVNTALVALSGIAVLLHASRGGRVLRVESVLALAGIAACVFHLRGGIADLARSGTWIGAAAAGLAFAHLGQHTRIRRWAAAALVALLIPLALRAGMYVFVEHPMTVDRFYQNQDAYLRSRGWEPGSAQAELYLRRMEDAAALGYYGLSNVFGSILAALTLLSVALTIGVLRRRGLRAALVPAVTGGLGLVALLLTQSKGAALAFAMGCGLLALVALVSRWAHWRQALPGLIPAAGLAMVVMAVLAVLVRGWAGAPASVAGERSLYFRYQYWGGAVRLIAADPLPRLLVGVGPGAFQEGYTTFKDPRNPEEVTSTHNAVLDWVAMLGVGGIAWSALMVLWLWRAGRGAAGQFLVPPSPESEPDLPLIERPTAWIAAVVGLALFVPQYVLQFPVMALLESRLVWIGGLAGFVIVATVMASRVASEAWLAVGLFVASAVLLTHGQIEMTFFHQGAVAAAWLVVALAASGRAVAEARASDRPTGWAVGGAFLLVGGLLVVLYATPVTKHESALGRAAEHLRQSRLQALPEVDRELRHALAAIPNDPVTRRWAATFYLEAAHAYARAGNRAGVAQAIRHAESFVSPENITRVPSMLLRTRAQVEETAAFLLGDPERRASAIRGWQEVLARSPAGLQDHLTLADLLWADGQHAQARELYRRVLWLSEQAYLDPAMQLSAGDEARVRERLGDSR